jgi:signal transduction histidine kinase
LFSSWFGNALGQALIAPLVLTFFSGKKVMTRQSVMGLGWLTLLVLPIAMIVFATNYLSSVALTFAVTVPVLILIAAKGGITRVSLATTLLAVTALSVTKQHSGAFVYNGTILLLDLTIYVLGMIIAGQFVAALLAEHKQAQRAQQEALERLLKIADRVPGLVYQFRLNPDGSSCFPYASPAIHAIYRVSPEAVRTTAADVFAIIHPDDYARVAATIKTSAHDLTPWHCEYRVKFAEGDQQWLLGDAVPQREPDGSVLWHGFITDISERKLREAELIRSNADLEQFAYAVSHDMRQPLRMITSYLSLLEQALVGQLTEDTQLFFDFALNGAKRMDAMILSLLEYSRIGRRPDAKTDINSRASLDEALAFLEPERLACGGDIKVTGDWPAVFCSGDELTRLLQNVVGNALKYHAKDQAPQVHIHGIRHTGGWRVEISDQGIGIEPKQTQRLFKVFSRLQARSDFDGTGIGLALCRKIVDYHGGSIGVISAGEGQGSLFWFELPFASMKTV